MDGWTVMNVCVCMDLWDRPTSYPLLNSHLTLSVLKVFRRDSDQDKALGEDG